MIKKEKAIVYGIGNFFEKICQKIRNNYEVIAYVDKNLEKTAEGNSVISLEKALEQTYDRIIVTILNVQICYELIQVLIQTYGVEPERIILGNIFMYENGEIDYCLKVNSKGDIVFEQKRVCIAARNIDEFNNIYDIYEKECYSYFLNKKEDVVLDIGMNIGGATLFFASKKHIKRVYGYEPFSNTYQQALYNIEKNSVYKEKIRCYQYGIGNKTEFRNITYNPKMSCGQSTIEERNRQARKNYEEWKLISRKDDILEQIDVRDIKEVLTYILESHRNENIVLKIDCEGEEYNIFNRIDECGFFERIAMIMMEWHYGGKSELVNILEKNNFAFWEFSQNRDSGLIYAVNLKKGS